MNFSIASFISGTCHRLGDDAEIIESTLLHQSAKSGLVAEGSNGLPRTLTLSRVCIRVRVMHHICLIPRAHRRPGPLFLHVLAVACTFITYSTPGRAAPPPAKELTVERIYGAPSLSGYLTPE